MTLTYGRDDQKRRIVITLAGAFDLAGILALVDRLAAEAAWSYSLLYDAREVTGVPTMSELQTIIDRVQVVTAQKPRGPIAVVAPDASLHAMVGVYASRLAGTVDIAAFHTLDEGKQWLDKTSNEM